MLQRRAFLLRSSEKSEEVKEGGKRRKKDEGCGSGNNQESQIFQGTPLKSGKIYYHPQCCSQKPHDTTSPNFNDESTKH
jgi:hypothetical protein